MTNIASFVTKHRKQINEVSIKEKIKNLPWYKRPIERSAFISRKAKDGKYYVRHNEWAEKIWIGPYNTIGDVDKIIDSYILKSSIEPLNRITTENELHSLW